MNRIALLTLASAIAGSLAAQSNTVPGLDGRLSVVSNLTYWGHRGAAHPNGETGMAMLNEMCNPGTVNIPWQAAMQPNHPKFGFLIVRESGGKIEQISDWSFCKHAFVSTNYSGPCGTCQSTGGLGGSVMGINCADTYGEGNNGDPYWLGPPVELNPWLGTWNPVGSYFDVGDPQTGLGPADGVRSLNINGFDQVKNRVTVKDQDLLTAGAEYFYGIQLMHQGEAVANRGDNNASRGFNPVYTGGGWSFANNSVGQIYGSILQHWTGASVDSGGNGNDDGRFFVAAKVTSLGGGNWHYEYAVHNVDNDRGGATFRLPIDASATASNFTFGDIDTNPLNDWTPARVGNEIVFSAPANNPMNWNTIYNFGFDANFAAGQNAASIDEARIGPGALTVNVPTKTPSGSTYATNTSVGEGCGDCARSFYENSFDLANLSVKLAFAAGAYTVSAGTNAFVAPTGASLNMGDDTESSFNLPFTLNFPGGSTTLLRICSNGFISPVIGNGNSWTPSSSGLLTGLRRWAACWHDLTPSSATNNVYVNTAPGVVRVTWLNVPNYSAPTGSNTFQMQFESNGNVHFIYQTMTVNGDGYLVGYSPGGNAADPGPRDISAGLGTPFTLCTTDALPLALAASARPVLGTSINLTTSNIPSGSLLGILILSLTQYDPGIELTVIQMPTCYLYAGLDSLTNFATPGASAVVPYSFPNTPSLSGTVLVGQSATLSPGFNPFGFLSSNGLVMVLGIN